MSEQNYWIAFNMVQGIGPATLRTLLEHFGSVRAAWEAPASALEAARLNRRARENLLKMRKALDLKQIADKVAAAGAHVLTWADDAYPTNLRNLDDAPPVLYVKGTLTEADRWALGVVGTRKPTGYGRAVTQDLVGTLARSGLTVVSGMALGIDGEAHRAALEAGGRTIAVLGCGVDVVYPARHRDLAEAIPQSGAIVSDYPLGTRPEGKNFPPRNRIISGLSVGVLIVEAGERSGALITADYAASQGRDAFAVPGPVLSANSQGTNRLIQDGAKLVLGAEDILEELNLGMAIQQAEVRETIPADGVESRLLQLLAEAGPLHIDELCRRSQLDIAKVSSDLTLLELQGMVRKVGGMTYALASGDRMRDGGTNTQYIVD